MKIFIRPEMYLTDVYMLILGAGFEIVIKQI